MRRGGHHYLARDNPLAYGLAVRMKAQRLSKISITWAGKHYYQGISQGMADTQRRNIGRVGGPLISEEGA